MTWLRAGVPITLLADLAARGGPLSREILAYEAVSDDVAASVPAPRESPSGKPSSQQRKGFSRASGA